MNVKRYFRQKLDTINFEGSKKYWENRYKNKGSSGVGSYGKFAKFKAEVLNQFISENKIKSVIDLGCGDGNQISLIDFPKYTGFDVSPTAIQLCKKKFEKDKLKSFFLFDPLCFVDNQRVFKAKLSISLDVLFHLVEEDIFNEYMNILFDMSNKFVIIYSSNFEKGQKVHERDRIFTEWIKKNKPNWELIKFVKNKYPYNKLAPNETSKSDFYIFEKRVGCPAVFRRN